jgi:hypothetical protein
MQGPHARDCFLRDAYRADAREMVAVKQFLKKTSLVKSLKVFGPFVGSFALGVILLRFYPLEWNWSEQLRGLADAFLVAGIIGFLIEVWAASALIEHVSEELSSRLVGYGLPKAAQNLISSLVKTKLVYRNYRKTFRFAYHPEKQDHVLLSMTLSYTVLNNGHSPEDYAPWLAEEGMYSPKLVSVQYRDQVLRLDDIPKETDDHKGVHWKPKKIIPLVPSEAATAIDDLKDNQRCDVRWDYSVEMRDYYSDVTSFGGVTINPEFELLELPPNLEFLADINDCNRQDGSGIWRYQRAFIAGQHIRVWWKPLAENDAPAERPS